MSLATQCPHCGTTFRVAQDQLKLRAGLVRCGACQEIFNGAEYLLTDAADQTEGTAANSAPANPAPQKPLSREHAAIPASSSDALDFAYPDFSQSPSDAIESVEPVDFIETPRPTLEASQQQESVHGVADNPSDSSSPQTAHFPAEPTLPSEPYLADMGPEEAVLIQNDEAVEAWEQTEDAVDVSEADEPDFLRHGRRRQKFGRGLGIAMALASLALLLGAFAQTVYIFRDQLAARLPQAKPALLTACAHLHCRIDLPAQIESISIESNELETINPAQGTSMLTMLLRNVGTTAQAWPYVELTLNDANGTMLARRVFAPREYLPDAQAVAAGLAADSEQSIKLYIEFSDVKPAGYHVGVFYP